MKVLWVVNHMLPHLSRHISERQPTSGTWLIEVFNRISNDPEIDLYIACPGRKNMILKVGSVNYYVLKMNMLDFYHGSSLRLKADIEKLLTLISPDIMHVHGTEFAFNHTFLRAGYCHKLVSIQGLISQISLKKYSLAGMYQSQLFRPSKFHYILSYVPIIFKVKMNLFRAKSEALQLKEHVNVIGRTFWDKAHTRHFNPSRKYFHLEETIREVFINRSWSQKEPGDFSLFCATGFANPIKGAHNVFEALFLLKKEFNQIVLKIPGENILSNRAKWGYNLYLKAQINHLDLKDNIEFLGVLSDEEMCEQYTSANVTILGSSIENSSNSLAEAMSVGAPIVAPFVGGLTSLATDEKDILFYPSNDTIFMAWQIKRILINPELASKLHSKLDKRRLGIDHNARVVNKLKELYQNIALQDLDNPKNL